MEHKIIIKQLFRDSIDDQVSVLLGFNPNQDREQCKRDWENKQYCNPLGDSIIFGAYLNGKLVGLNAYMPVEYNINGQKIAFVQSCDSKVLSECRGHGIWSKIVKAAVDYIFNETEYSAVIGFPNYRNSYPGFMKMKWQTLEHMNNYILVNNPMLFAKMTFPKNSISQIFGQMVCVQRLFVNLSSTNGYEVRECGLGEILWDDVVDKLYVSHTDELLKWKRLYKSINTIAICKNGKVMGTCIYSFDRFKGHKVCRIEKFVTVTCSMSKKKEMFAAVMKYIKDYESQAAFVRMWTMAGNESDRLCRRLLFFKSDHPNPFIIKQPDDKFNDINWNLSFFDLD